MGHRQRSRHRATSARGLITSTAAQAQPEHEEAAQACGVPIGTIRSRVARARDDLLTAMNADSAPAAEASPARAKRLRRR